uniref:Uncharacterized protein n=1 Tax=Pseudomonas marincola TaxID=437900 RepID=A0A653E0Y9_9PSED
MLLNFSPLYIDNIHIKTPGFQSKGKY